MTNMPMIARCQTVDGIILACPGNSKGPCGNTLLEEVKHPSGVVTYRCWRCSTEVERNEIFDYSLRTRPRQSRLDQPPPIRNGNVAVWDLVISDMHERDAVGRARYGTPLQPHNGRDALADKYSELLDAIVYTRQFMEEMRVLGGELWDIHARLVEATSRGEEDIAAIASTLASSLRRNPALGVK